MTHKHYITLVYYLTFIILGSATSIIGPTLHTLADNAGISLAQFGLYLFGRIVGYTAGTQLAGWLFDRFSGHKLLSSLLFLLGVAVFLTPWAHSLTLLVLVGLFTGVVESGVDVGGNTLTLWQHPGNVDSYMNGLHFTFGLGAFLAPLIVAQTISSDGVPLAYAILATTTLIPVLLLLFLPSPQQPTRSEDHTATISNPMIVFVLVSLIFLYVGVEVTLGDWLFTYAQELNLANESEAAYLTSAFWGSFTFGRLVGIPLARRFMARHILLADLVASVFFVALLLVWVDSTIVWIGVMGIGFCSASIFPTVMNIAEKNTHMSGQVTSLFFFGAGGGTLILPSMMGWIFETATPQTVMVIMLLSFVLMLGVYGMMLRVIAASHRAKTRVVAP